MSMTDNDIAEERAMSRRYGRPNHEYSCCCARCMGEGPDDDRTAEEPSPLARRLDAAGYEEDSRGRWVKRLRPTYHVARRDHKDGKIKAGQRYCSVIAYYVDADGRGWRRTVRWVVVGGAK